MTTREIKAAVPKKKTIKVKAYIWKGFDVKRVNKYPLEALIRFEKPDIRKDFVPCTITYTT